MLRKSILFLIMILSLTVAVVPTFAQDEGVAFASGFAFPRGLAFDVDGNLFVAEAGAGGDKIVTEVEGAQITAGLTSQVSMVAPDGTVSVVIGNLSSAFLPFEGAGLGVQRAYPVGDSIWLVLSEHQNLTVFSDAIVEVDRATGRVKHYIDLLAHEQANNPDETEEIYSNPSDIAMGPDGKLYIIDTGANALLGWTEEEGLTTVHAWTEATVPTAIEFAEDGSFYVGFLGIGIAPGAGHIEHWSADGSTLIETFSNLTAVTDILLAQDGSLYAVQLLTEMTEQGPNPISGNVVKVTAEGATPVAEGLYTPFGLAQDADGNLYVSVGSAFAEPTAGEILKITLG
ncbi:MAG: ScyD/ScyE family protein [Anaerolineae bacterium]|nr:ScyD/ScyE family protein [Anaerolineae bacterium]